MIQQHIPMDGLLNWKAWKKKKKKPINLRFSFFLSHLDDFIISIGATYKCSHTGGYKEGTLKVSELHNLRQEFS